VCDVGSARIFFIHAGTPINKLLAYGSSVRSFCLVSWASSILHWTGFSHFRFFPRFFFIAALFALLYYLGVMQVCIRGMAWAMQRVMGASGAECLNVAASIFMGQTEAPLTIRPFLPDLTDSELMTIMTSGMAMCRRDMAAILHSASKRAIS